MSLFQINRYIGDDDDIISDENRGVSAQKILDKINREAASRKKSKLEDGDFHESGIQNSAKDEIHIKLDSTTKTTGKKDRKRKQSDNLVLESQELSADSEETDCLQKRLKEGDKLTQKLASKKKKRKIEEVNKEKFYDEKKTVQNSIKNNRKTACDIETSIQHKSEEQSDSPSLSEDENKSTSEIITKDSDTERESDNSNKESDNENIVEYGVPNEIGGFTLLGQVKGKVHKQVKRVLPEWLADPSVITADLKNKTVPVSQMTDLDQDLQELLQKNGITHFFPVQIQVIPMMLESLKMGFLLGKAGYRPNDICVSAATGSGKTLAFVLPIVQALKSRVTCQVRALVVLPVRDLAIQVFKVFKTYCGNTKLKVVLLVGQKQFLQEQQSLVKQRSWGYESLADIVVATPGRLVDHISSTAGFCLTQLRFLVIDEADIMMDHIKQDWLTQVESAVYCDGRLPPGSLTVANARQFQIPLQKLLFSATLSQNPDKLQQLNLFQPKLFTSVSKGGNLLKPVDLIMSPEKTSDGEAEEKSLDQTEDISQAEEQKGEFIGKYTTPEGLTEYFVECTAAEKPLIILHFLKNLKFRNILCFTNSVEATHRLYHCIKLVGGVEVREFSSGLHTARRNRIIQEFSKGKLDIVICSDAMARGMDIDNVKYVISYDPPPFIKTYIHRVGRTARAGKVGTAITMLQNKEFYHFKKMTKDAGKTGIKELKIPGDDLQPIVPAFQSALEELQQVLQAEKIKRKSLG